MIRSNWKAFLFVNILLHVAITSKDSTSPDFEAAYNPCLPNTPATLETAVPWECMVHVTLILLK